MYSPGAGAAAAPAEAARLGGGPAAARQRSQAAHLQRTNVHHHQTVISPLTVAVTPHRAAPTHVIKWQLPKSFT